MPKRRRGAGGGQQAAAAAAAPAGAGVGAQPAEQTVEQVLESLLQGAAAAVRPVTKEELRDAADGDSDDRALPLRQAAEALLVVGDAVNSAEFRQRHGDRWVPLMLALDARFSRVMATCPEADAGLWDGDQSTLMSSLNGRPSDVAVRVDASLGSGGGLAKVGVMDQLLAILGRFGRAPQELGGLQATIGARMVPAASSQRPTLACDVARFDVYYPVPTAAGAAAAAGVAVAEARCEVSCEEQPSGGTACVGGDFLAFVGGTGWKQRGPYLAAGRISDDAGGAYHGGGDSDRAGGGDRAGDDDWRNRLSSLITGFFERGCRVALDPPRGLVWSAGGESRIKAFRIGATGQGACQFTLESAQADLLGVLGGRVLSALDDGSVEYWDIARLTPQRQWIEAMAVHEQDANEMEREYGCKALDGIDNSMNDDFAEAEATAGDRPHGKIHLVGQGSGRLGPVTHLLVVGPELEGDAEPQQVVASFDKSASLWVFDWPTATLSALLTGHAGLVTDASTSAGLPHLVAAGSYDGTVRVWDLRTHACTHVLASKGCTGVRAVALAEDQGQPFCFSFGGSDEAILCWDLRTRRCLYELATGNTDVVSLQWHAPSRSLFASTDCDYIDRHGNDYDYGAMAGLRWPQCMHKPSDVPHPWDAGRHLLILYAFKDVPDRTVLPPRAEEDSECEYSSSGEEGQALRETWQPRERGHYW